MKKEHCCEELAGKLGKGSVYPKPAYISQEDWEHSGHLEWWYPGADGPGYYMIHEMEEMEWISTPTGVFGARKIEYRHMMECPYCGDVKRVG